VGDVGEIAGEMGEVEALHQAEHEDGGIEVDAGEPGGTNGEAEGG